MKKIIAAVVLLSSSWAYANEPRLKAGDKIYFPNGNIACDTRDNLKTAVLASLNGSIAVKPIFEQLFGKENGEGVCIFIGPGTKLKILSVEYNSPETPGVGVIEILGEKSSRSKKSGAWALTVGAVRR